MHHSLHIRAGEPADAARLAVLATQVWLHTYATDGIGSEIASYVLAELTPDKYTTLLHDSTAHVLAAENAESLIGFAVIKFGAPCPAGTNSTAELQTLYVQEHFMGRGIGRALLLAAETEARKRSGSTLWLTVNARNDRAIAFYRRQGYSKIGTTYFVLGEQRHENHVLVGRGE
jgi:ribosomal protein S18 acetylase RimI-like enzyme